MQQTRYGSSGAAGRKLVKTNVPGVYRRGNRYVVRFRDGQGRARKRSARTLAEARQLKAQLAADVSRGEYRALSRVTFAEYAPQWLATYQGRTARGFRDTTREEYRRDLEKDAIPFFGRMRLAEIEPRDVKRFCAMLAETRGLAPATVRLILAPVRALLATAVEEGLIRSNPAAGLRIAQRIEPDEPEKRKALTEDELRALLGEIPIEHRLLIELLAHTGLRISEALGLRWEDVDFGARRLRVRRALRNGVYAPPKSRYGRRDVPLSPGMATKLWEARKLTTYRGDTQPVFATQAGTPLDQSNVYSRVLKPAARRAGVPWAAFHTLRHTCATMLFRNGLNAKQVQAWLGHHSPAFTLAVYVHLLPDDLPDPGFLDEIATAREKGNQSAPAPAAPAVNAGDGSHLGTVRVGE